MDDDIRNKIMNYMKKTRFCTLATVGRKSMDPRAHIVFYQNSGLDVYFNTGKSTDKAKNIMSHPMVALTIYYEDPSAKELQDTRGILYSGKAEMVKENDFDKVPEGVKKVYEMVNEFYPGEGIIFKVAPKKIHFIDYSKGFGHRDVLDL